MAVDDTWYLAQKVEGKRVPSSKHGRGKRWRVRYRDDTGAPKERLFERQADAENFDAEVRTDVNRGTYIDPGGGKQTVAEYARGWLALQIHRPSTAELYQRSFRLHVLPQLGRLRLADVRRSHIQAWAKDRSAVLAPRTMANLHGHLVSMFAAAVGDRAIAASPCVDIHLPDVDTAERFIPTPEQIHALAAAVPARYAAMVYAAAGCGLRQGEIWGLELEHVDFLRRELRVVQQLVRVPGGPPFLGPPKTKTSRRAVELGAVTAEKLARHVELFPPQLVLVEDRTDPRPAKWRMREARLVFVNARGRPIVASNWARPWTRAVAAVGIAADFTFHGLRHYYATLLIHQGATVKTVQKALGHSKPSITSDLYTHEWPDVVNRTRNLVDAVLGDPLAQIRPNSGRLA